MTKIMKRSIGVILLVLLAALSYAQGNITGTVTNKNGEAVEGASVRILNTHIGTITAADGTFALEVAPGRYVLYITAVGFAGKEQSVDATQAGGTSVSVTLAEDVVELEDIVVTAQKEEGDIQEVPFSINALSARKVEEYRIWNSRNITAITPNLYSADPGDNRNVTSIRGITSSSYDPAVATYIDGVNQFTLDTYIAPLFDIERIEVLRGPQGTLYGRNAMGGVINIITKRPTNKTGAFAEASLGSYGQQRYAFGVRTPLIKNKLFFGVSGMYDRMDGFYTNDFTGDDFDRRHSYTGNYYLTYQLNQAWSFTLNAKHHTNRNDGAFTLATPVAWTLDNPFRVNQNALTTLMDDSFNGSLNIHHAGAGVDFVSLSTYQSNYRYYSDPIDGDFSAADIITIVNNYGRDWNRTTVWTQEFKLASPASSTSPLKWTAGAYLFLQNSPVKQGTHFGENGGLFGAQPFTTVVNTTDLESSGYAFFGQATYSLLADLDFTVGARYDYERKDQSVRGEYFMDGMAEPVAITQNDTSAVVSYNAFSPKASMTYHVSDDHHVYGVYSKGYRTGGLTQLSSDPSTPPLYAYKPEYSNNFEVGVKNSFVNNRVKLNVALFYTKVTDAQVPTLVLPEAITVTRNAGELTSQGIEFEFSATPLTGLQIDYNFGYTDATYNTLRIPSGGVETNLEGNRQIFTPEYTSMLAVQHSIPLASWQNLKAVIRAEWMHMGTQYFDLANNIEQPGYHLFNTRMGVAADSWEVMFWGRNLADETYIAYAYDFGAAHLGDPFNWGVTFRKSF